MLSRLPPPLHRALLRIGQPVRLRIWGLLRREVRGCGVLAFDPAGRLLLVRHGETDWNREGRFQGQIDIPLNSTGRSQAEAAGRFLAPVTIHRAYTSCMARPRQTAEAILAAHPGFYGELVWIMTMLEQWLRAHAQKT